MNKLSEHRIRIILIWGILLFCGLLYLALPVYALRWSKLPFPGFMMDPNLVVSDTGQNHAWPAKLAVPPVAYPDRITAVNNSPITSNNQFNAQLSVFQIGDDIDLTLAQPQNSRITSAAEPERVQVVPLIAFNANDLWNHFWLYYLAGLIMLLLGVGTFYLRPDTAPGQIFTLFSAVGAVSLGAIFDLNTTQAFTRIWLTAVAFIGSINLLLAAHFPYKSRLFVKQKWINWIIFVPSLLVLIWAQVWLHLPSDPWAYAIAWRAMFLLDGLGILIAFFILGYRSAKSPSPLVKQQVRIILVSAVLAFTPLIFFFTIAAMGITIPEWFPQSLWLPPVIIYPLAIAYTIVRYRLMDMNIVVRRGTTYVILLALMTGVLVLLVTGLTAAFGNKVSFDNPFFLILLVIFVAVIFDPLRNWLQKGLDHYVFQQPVTLNNLRSDYNRELTTAVSANQVANILLKYVETGIPGAAPQLYLPDSRMGGYCNFTDNGGDVLIEPESPLVNYMSQSPDVLDLTVPRAWPEELRQHPKDIEAQHAVIIAPMNNGAELLGWISLPEKASGQMYTQSELNYLGDLADQSLIGLERANAMRRLEARVSELDLLSQFSQTLNFTIDPDTLMELVFTNYQRLLHVDNFFITLQEPANQRRYMAFYIENGERLAEKEGRISPIEDKIVHQVWATGQTAERVDENGRLWWYAPLNAGAETLGVLYAFFEDAEQIPARHHQLFNVFADRTAVALDRLQTRQQLAARAQQLELINQVTAQLAATLELEPLLNLILDKAIEILNTEAGTFMLTIEDTGELEFRVVRGPASADLLNKRLPIGTGLAGTAAQTGRPIVQNRVQEDTRWFGEMDPKEEFITHSILTVPLMRQNAVLGVVQVINKRNGAPFNQEDESLLTAFAGQAVIALENARLLEQTDQQLQQRVSELFMLQQLDRDLTTTLDLAHILNLTLDWALRISDGSAGFVILVDDEQTPYLKARLDDDKKFIVEPAMHNALVQGVEARVLATGQPHVTGNVFAEPDYVPASYNTLSQITLPVIHQQKLIGIAVIESNRLDAFGEEDMETAVRLTNHAAVAIANALLYEQVKEANLAKSEFVSMVSHELKTPMTSMRGFTDLLLSGMTGELNPQQKSFLETISANIKRMSQQIQDLTDISRIETGQLRVETSPTAFANIVSETLQTVRGPFDEKEIELQLDLPTDLPLIMADNGRMVQVLTNLLSNAYKYSPEKTAVLVTIYPDALIIDPENPPQPVVVCSVKDNGYGISLEDQEKLFTKFFRAEDPNIRKATGTGLGLSITKGIIELHHGKIWVESEPGHGTTFSFAIPQATE